MNLKELLPLTLAGGLIVLIGFFWLAPGGGLKAAPAVTVPTLSGAEVDLGAYRGQPLLVTFWATTCPGCVKEIPHLMELQESYGPQGLKIVAIAMAYDPPDQVREMVRQRGMNYTVALDREGRAAQAFGEVQLTPTTFLINPQGRIVQQKIGEVDIALLRQRIERLLQGDPRA